MAHIGEMRQRLIDSHLMTTMQADTQIAHWRQEATADNQNGEALLV